MSKKMIIFCDALVVVVVIFNGCVNCTLSCHLVAVEVLVVGGDLIYDSAVRHKLDDAVRSCLYNLVVSASEELNTLELDHTLVEGCDGFHVKVVCRLIEDQAVST